MSVWSRIRARLGGAATRHTPGEADVSGDSRTAGSRATGGTSDPAASDTHSTTGTTPNREFVGRAGGDDPGDAGITGAEVRARHESRGASDEGSA
jgi:hypothetical protein